MANDYQIIALNADHSGKIKVTGEFSIPELADLVTPPLGENAIGMKAGITYHWNRIDAAWQEMAPVSADFEYSSAILSTAITSSFMTATYPTAKSVVFSNLTDYPDNIAVVEKFATGWFINLYGNKLA